MQITLQFCLSIKNLNEIPLQTLILYPDINIMISIIWN